MWSDLAALDDHRLGATNSPFKLPITLTITSVVAPNILAGQNNGKLSLELDFADPHSSGFIARIWARRQR